MTGIPSQLEDPAFFFDPSLQWIAYRQDNFDYLGFHDNQSIHTVTFVQGTGGTLEGQLKQTVYSGQSASAPTPKAAEGHQFNGWQGSYTNVRADETVRALWKAISYTISFDSAGGSGISSIRQDYGTPIKTLPLPVRAGHTFLGWDQPVPETMPASDLILTARWAVNQYTLTFDSRGGSPVAAMVLDFGSAIVAPPVPEHELYEFAGWKPELPTNMPEGDLTVRAQWRFKGMLLPDEDVLVPVTGAVPPLVPPLVLTGLSMVFLILAQMIRRKKKATGRT